MSVISLSNNLDYLSGPKVESQKKKGLRLKPLVAGCLLVLSLGLAGCTQQKINAEEAKASITPITEALCSGEQVVTDWDGNEYIVPKICGTTEIILNGTIKPLPDEDSYVMGSAKIALSDIETTDEGTPYAPGIISNIELNQALNNPCARELIINKEGVKHALAFELLNKIGYTYYNHKEGKGYTAAPYTAADALAVAEVVYDLTDEQKQCLRDSGYDPDNFPKPETSIAELTADGEWDIADQCQMYDLILQFLGYANNSQRPYVEGQILTLKESLCTKQ